MIKQKRQESGKEKNVPDNVLSSEDKEWLESVNLVEDIERDNNVHQFKPEVVDANSVENDIEKSDKTFNELVNQSYIDMDKAFLQYLNNFNEDVKKQAELKEELKRSFLDWILVFMGAVIAFPYVMTIMFRTRITDISIVALSISSLAETLSAIIVLPKIIAKYLFNKKEDDNRIKIISRMQKYNKGKRSVSGDE